MALLEAMASALPIVATDVSGSKQVMVQDETGLLVSPGNVPELAEALTYLLCHSYDAKRMGQAARQRVDDSFSAKKQAKDHIALYAQAWRRSK
jgi:glycosyltransferase involved in cell wall biosynthesis